MARFIDYHAGYYLYQRNDRNYSLASALLNSLFNTYGYCVDPLDRTGLALAPSGISTLTNLASAVNDKNLLHTLTWLRNSKCPSPRLANDSIINEVTLHDTQRFTHLTPDNQQHTLALLQNILHIGLYLGGWKGVDEPYMFQLKPVSDPIRMELKIFPIITVLHNDQAYSIIKNFPIISYQFSSNLKPLIVDQQLTIDKCLGQVALGMTSPQDYGKLANYFIATAYYYITTICAAPLPTIEPLIHSLVKY